MLLYPEGTSRREVHPDEGKTLAVESTRSPRGQVTVKIGPSSEPLVLRIKEAEGPSSVAVETAGAESALTEAPSFEALEGLSAGWSFDDERDYVWVRLPATDTETVVQYGG